MEKRLWLLTLRYESAGYHARYYHALSNKEPIYVISYLSRNYDSAKYFLINSIEILGDDVADQDDIIKHILEMNTLLPDRVWNSSREIEIWKK